MLSQMLRPQVTGLHWASVLPSPLHCVMCLGNNETDHPAETLEFLKLMDKVVGYFSLKGLRIELPSCEKGNQFLKREGDHLL